MIVFSASKRVRSALRVARAVLLRGALFGLLWVVFAGWDLAYAGYGAVSAAAATALSLAMFPVGSRRGESAPFRHRIQAAAVLPLWFIGKSAIGGADVAGRALRRRVVVAPAVVTAPCILAAGNSRELALLMMNLMPGTLVQCMSDDGETVELHTLAEDLDPAGQWLELQWRVAAAFGQSPR